MPSNLRHACPKLCVLYVTIPAILSPLAPLPLPLFLFSFSLSLFTVFRDDLYSHSAGKQMVSELHCSASPSRVLCSSTYFSMKYCALESTYPTSSAGCVITSIQKWMIRQTFSSSTQSLSSLFLPNFLRSLRLPTGITWYVHLQVAFSATISESLPFRPQRAQNYTLH